MGHVRASVEAEHQYGHHAEGGGQECEDELVCEPGEVVAVAGVGEQADVEAEPVLLEGELVGGEAAGLGEDVEPGRELGQRASTVASARNAPAISGAPIARARPGSGTGR